jgi:hypothetical protein
MLHVSTYVPSSEQLVILLCTKLCAILLFHRMDTFMKIAFHIILIKLYFLLGSPYFVHKLYTILFNSKWPHLLHNYSLCLLKDLYLKLLN